MAQPTPMAKVLVDDQFAINLYAYINRIYRGTKVAYVECEFALRVQKLTIDWRQTSCSTARETK
jgi:hypothetical protein